MFKVYRMTGSGNCYKVKLLLKQLKLPFAGVGIDILNDETCTPAFLAMNLANQVSALEIKPAQYSAQPNPILYYLSKETPFLPEDNYTLRSPASV